MMVTKNDRNFCLFQTDFLATLFDNILPSLINQNRNSNSQSFKKIHVLNDIYILMIYI